MTCNQQRTEWEPTRTSGSKASQALHFQPCKPSMCPNLSSQFLRKMKPKCHMITYATVQRRSRGSSFPVVGWKRAHVAMYPAGCVPSRRGNRAHGALGVLGHVHVCMCTVCALCVCIVYTCSKCIYMYCVHMCVRMCYGCVHVCILCVHTAQVYMCVCVLIVYVYAYVQLLS